MDDLVGRALGPYELLDRIETGGMATVYRGVHRALGQPRAIKILLPAFAADASLVERFKAEARIASGLRHPNIVSIYDVGEQDGLFYLVMDLVEGVSLGRLLRSEKTLDLERAVHVLRQLASALDYAHGRGIVHRDIKASNVLVGEDDHVSLFDFGIARAAAALDRITVPGQVVGTPEYLAPEVITGAEGDDRSDFYAVGVLAYQLLAGRLPFASADTITLLYAQVSKTPPSLCEIRPELPVAVERVVMRQLAKAPEARYRTAGDFVSALHAAIPVTTSPSTLPAAPTPAPPEPQRSEPGQVDPASQTAPGLDDDLVTPLPSSRGRPDEEIVTPRSLVRSAAPEPMPWGGSGLALIAVVVLSVAGFWALSTGRLETYVGMALGIEPTPTVVLSTRPEPTVASIVVDQTPSVVAAVPPPVFPPAVASPEAAAATPALAAAPPPVTADLTSTTGLTTTSEPTAIPVAPVATLPTSPEQQLAQAQAQAEGGEYVSALSILGSLKESAPSTDGLDDALYRAYLGHGQQLLEHGLLDESYAAYGEGLKLRPDDPAALEGQRQVVLTKHWATMEAAWDQDNSVASAALEEILALDPGYRDADVKLYALLVAQADRLIGAGDVDGALTVLRRAQEVYPEGEEARALIEAHTPPPTPEAESGSGPSQNPAPAPAVQPMPKPEPTPAPKPASKPAPSKPQPPSGPIPLPPGLPSLPNPGGLPIPRP